jgi:hypothetical protein
MEVHLKFLVVSIPRTMESGLNEMESMPQVTRKRAKSGSHWGPGHSVQLSALARAQL